MLTMLRPTLVREAWQVEHKCRQLVTSTRPVQYPYCNLSLAHFWKQCSTVEEPGDRRSLPRTYVCVCRIRLRLCV